MRKVTIVTQITLTGITKMTKSNFDDLKGRVVKGNELLHTAWWEACSVAGQPAEYEKIMARIERIPKKIPRIPNTREATASPLVLLVGE